MYIFFEKLINALLSYVLYINIFVMATHLKKSLFQRPVSILQIIIHNNDIKHTWFSTCRET